MTRVNRSRAVRSDINRHFNRNKSQGANADNGELPIKDVQKYQLRNGLTILLREDHSVPIVSTMICYRVGSRFESPGVSGISHFLEHMMFKGTKKYGKGEIDYITTRRGGSNNAFTSHDYTAYYFTFASDRWEAALEIEADRMRNSLFDPEELELEREVILEELKMELDSPWGALRQAVESQAFSVHPYRSPVIGTAEDISSITMQQMFDHYRLYYTPGNATLAVVGDIQMDHVLNRIEVLFGSFSPSELPEENRSVEPRHHRQIRIQLEKPTHVPRVFIAFPAPSVCQNEHYALHVLDKILSEGKLSRLYRRLIEKDRIASTVTTEFAETFDPHLFFVCSGLYQGVHPQEAESIIFDEMAELRNKFISEDELRRAQNQCLMQALTGFETTLDQAVQLGLMEILNDYQYWASYNGRIRQLTVRDVQKVAQEYLTPEQSTVGILAD